jgi:hypothetical protein
VIKYLFKEPLIGLKDAKRANPQRIGEALAKIGEQNGGRLTPAATVEAARPERHLLHRHFEWNDAEAAEAYRLDQARTLIRCIRVTDDTGPTPRIAFLSIADGRAGHAYFSASTVAGSRQLQILVLAQAERDLHAWERRYSELQDICRSVRELRETIAERRARLGGEDHPPA